jgi:hypothetical protein
LLRHALDGHGFIFSCTEIIFHLRARSFGIDRVNGSQPQGKTLAGPPGVGFGGLKAPSGMGKLGTAGVLRLRAKSGLSRNKSAGRSAQDDDLWRVGDAKNQRLLGPFIAC